MSLKSIIFASALVVASATASCAATYQLGNLTSATNTGQILSVQSIDFLEFSLNAPSGSFVSMLDISVSSEAGSNFRPIIGLYSGTSLIASNDSGLAGGTASLSFSSLVAPIGGFYTLGVGAWKANFTNDIADAASTAFFNNGSYSVSITPAISPIPLPAGGLLLLTALAALMFKRRKTHCPLVSS